jgi:hypothetical protein
MSCWDFLELGSFSKRYDLPSNLETAFFENGPGFQEQTAPNWGDRIPLTIEVDLRSLKLGGEVKVHNVRFTHKIEPSKYPVQNAWDLRYLLSWKCYYSGPY